MKKHRFPEHIIKAKVIITITCSFLVALAIAGGTSNIAYAKKPFTDDFNALYGTNGTDMGTTLGSCITCHTTLEGKGYNPYGVDFLVNGKNFAAIEALDSDGDGFDNLTEIIDDAFPGDPANFPQPGNSPPVADAGSDQTMNEGAGVVLDGSGSYDPEGAALSYLWKQKGGLPVTLSDATAVQPSFTAPAVGSADEVLTLELTVTDDTGQSATDVVAVTVTWINAPPVASAGPDQTVGEGVNVELDGSNSSDPDGNLASYAWVQITGTPVTLSDPSAVKPNFTSGVVGAGGESFTFEITVTDSLGLTATDTCIVNVTAGNKPPVADAGVDQTVDEGQTVFLNGSGSNDPDGVISTFQWTQTAGPIVALSAAAAAQPSFTAPDVGPGGDSLTFKLTVTDDEGLQSSDTCIVNVSWVNLTPVANAGSDQTGASSIEEGSTVALDGSGSSDPDDGVASYLWQPIGSGPAVTLSDPAAARPTFVTPVVSGSDVTLTFRLTVTDSGGLQATDEVLVTIYDNGIASFPTAVITTMSTEGAPIGIKADTGGSIIELTPMDPRTLPNPSELPEDLMYGLLDFQIKTDVPGGTATVVIYLSNPAPDGYKWYKYNAVTRKWIDYAATNVSGTKGAVFNAARDEVTLTLVDNGPGDDDGVQNGIIADPSGLGAASSSLSVGGLSDFGGIGGSNDFGGITGCFIRTAAPDSASAPFKPMTIIGWFLMVVLAGCSAALVCFKTVKQKFKTA
jgi:hypothetical protein